MFPVCAKEGKLPAKERNRLGCESVFSIGLGAGYRKCGAMVKFLLFCILLVLCWPLALLALVLYPFVWLVLLPFRIVGITIEGVLELIRAIFLFPVRVLRGPSQRPPVGAYYRY